MGEMWAFQLSIRLLDIDFLAEPGGLLMMIF